MSNLCSRYELIFFFWADPVTDKIRLIFQALFIKEEKTMSSSIVM